MSIIASRVKAEILGNAAARPSAHEEYAAMTDVDFSVKSVPGTTAVAVMIGVNIGSRAIVDCGGRKNQGAAITEAVRAIRGAVIEEVFGEFRRPIMNLRTALYDRDFDRAMTLLDDLANKMFTED